MNNTTAKVSACADCGAIKPLSARGLCRPCDEEIAFCPSDGAEQIAARALAPAATDVEDSAPAQGSVSELARDLTAISAVGSANAAVQGIGSMHGGQLRGVGFSSKEGYITAIRNGVPSHTHASYLTTLRTQYGLTSADIAALNLPGPMAVTALPVGSGIKHTPTGPSIFDKPKAERQFVVAPAAAQVEAEKPIKRLDTTNMIAGAIAEGHGAIFGWNGAGSPTRAQLSKALTKVDKLRWLPEAKSARAQLGRVMETLNGTGYVARVVPRKDCTDLAAGACRWKVQRLNMDAAVGESAGDVVFTAELDDVGTLTLSGNDSLAGQVRAGFEERISREVYQSADVTAWLGSLLRGKFTALRIGIGWYVPAKHVAAARALTEAIADEAGFGTDWIRPALPVATCDQLQDGIARSLTEEVAGLMARLATERETAKTERKAGDIGERRAGSFLVDLREIGSRAVAYGQIIGEERVAAVRERIRLAIVDLETVLGDDYTGIGARFAGIWDEIERDRSKSGGVL